MTPVLGIRTAHHNSLVFATVTGINKNLQEVFFCDATVHLWSRGQHVQPVNDYFMGEGDLTALGYFGNRACMFKEIGIAPYHW